MRIIHGKLKGFQFPVYRGSNTRPTSDLVKESLFNSLYAAVDFDGLKVVDLFAGTGNIGLEFLSRGAEHLLSIDSEISNIRYMDGIRKKLALKNWEIKKMDAMQFIGSEQTDANLVFADPPYDYRAVHNLVNKVLQSDWFLNSGTIFILEHVDRLVFSDKPVFLKKQYGNTSFTCFKA